MSISSSAQRSSSLLDDYTFPFLEYSNFFFNFYELTSNFDQSHHLCQKEPTVLVLIFVNSSYRQYCRELPKGKRKIPNIRTWGEKKQSKAKRKIQRLALPYRKEREREKERETKYAARYTTSTQPTLPVTTYSASNINSIRTSCQLVSFSVQIIFLCSHRMLYFLSPKWERCPLIFVFSLFVCQSRSQLGGGGKYV